MSESQLFPRLKDYINQDRAVTLAVVVRGPDDLVGVKALIPAEGESVGKLLEVPWQTELLRDAHHLMRERSDPVSCRYENGKVEVFFDIYRPVAT